MVGPGNVRFSPRTPCHLICTGKVIFLITWSASLRGGGETKRKKRAKQRPLSRRSTTTSIYSNRAWRSFSLTLLEAQAPPLPGRRFAVYEGPMRPPVSSAPPTFLSPFSHFGYPSLPASFSQFLGWVSSRSCKHASFCIFFFLFLTGSLYSLLVM